MTTYVYDTSDQAMLNVGWLAPDYAYRTGIVDDRVIDALKVLSGAYENQMRGFHYCEFCDADRIWIPDGPGGEARVWLGSAEIRVEGEDGTLYASPNLIIHYITEHRYCPPEEFCRAAVRTAGIETTGPLTVVE
ncbi:hypothetical protein [Streptomyces sp. NPDC048411]|uniref:DUF7919 family protein n=1 Tax=Streptomyces sp. NPDC048411 TaxID=3157206 RepID=UPI003452CB0E